MPFHEKIPAQFLYNCKSLTEVVLPETVTAIRKLAFASCSSLTEITLPEHVTTIENLAFMGCSSLTRVLLPDSVSFLQDTITIFLRCSSLRVVCFPAGITKIPNCFFQSNESLAEVVIPKSITEIGDEAFSDCTALSRVYYLGTQTDWASVTFGASNESIENARVFYYSETEPPVTADGTAYDGDFRHYAPDGVTPTVWEKES